jgi:hypothetical protein
MTDLDMLRDALAKRASQAPDTDLVLANTSEGVQRLRTRRRATALAGTVAVAVGVLVAGVAVLNRSEPGTDVQAAAASSHPVVAPAPGIRARLPFTVTVPAGYKFDSWSMDPPGAIADFRGSAGQIEVALSQRLPPTVGNAETQATTVRGIPAEIRLYTSTGAKPSFVMLTWEITPGMSALVSGSTEQQVRAVAESMTTAPSEPPSSGTLARIPAGLSTTYWGRESIGFTLVMFCPDQHSDKAQCAQLELNAGTAPDEVGISADGKKAPLGKPDAAGVRQTPDGRILVRQTDNGHWAEATIGTSISPAQLRDILLAVSAD